MIAMTDPFKDEPIAAVDPQVQMSTQNAKITSYYLLVMDGKQFKLFYRLRWVLRFFWASVTMLFTGKAAIKANEMIPASKKAS